jgi:hypothetical protein
MNKKMKLRYLQGVIICMVSSAFTLKGQDSLPQGCTLRQGTEVVLRIPYNAVFEDEYPVIYTGIKNLSAAPLKLSRCLSAEAFYQVMYETRTGLTGKIQTEAKFIPTWDSLISPMNSFQDFETLKQNDCRIYPLELLAPYKILSELSSEIRIGFLTGPNEWAFSNWAKLRTLKGQKVVDFEPMQTFIQKDGHGLKIRLTMIEGVSYLFVDGYRAARVPDGSQLRFEWNKEKNLLIIHFDGVNVPPVIHYVPMIETRKGSPETTPHLIALEALKAQLRGISLETPSQDVMNIVTNQTANSRLPQAEAIQPAVKQALSSNVIQAASSPSVSQPEPPHYRTWWLIAGAAVLVAMIGLKVKRK